MVAFGGMEPSPPNVLIDGDELRERRKLAGYTLVQFAEIVGITYQYVSQIERGERDGKRAVSPPVFVRICDALGIAEQDRRQLVRAAVAS